MEAVGSGLPMIGFDVRYGNQTFIQNEKNGYLIPFNKNDNIEELIENLSRKIIALLTSSNLVNLSNYSYKIADHYLEDKVQQKWQKLINEVLDD